MAPAPAHILPSLQRIFIVLHPSSIALSKSSSTEVVEPLRTIVDILFSSLSLLKIMHFYDEISLKLTSSANPSSSGEGVPSFTTGVAPTDLAILFNSNLDIILIAIILYFSKK